MDIDNDLDYLIQYFASNMGKGAKTEILNRNEKWELFRSLVNMRKPESISKEFLEVQDRLLKEMIAQKGIMDILDLNPVRDNLYIWQGDITTLKVDAIVNAANDSMLGCFLPGHHCIDNAIHTYAGVQLRLECDKLMRKQGHEEKTGGAKITKAYNLPCKYIIHTVGPFIPNGEPTEQDCEELANCYRSCMSIAVGNGLQSIAFCCVSTGVFCFPNDLAAQIAVKTVLEFPKSSPIKVIFNVFKDEDRRIYNGLLK